MEGGEQLALLGQDALGSPFAYGTSSYLTSYSFSPLCVPVLYNGTGYFLTIQQVHI